MAYLEDLQNAVSLLGRPVISVLAPGVDGVQVREALGIPVPVAVVEWFGWCNGVVDLVGQQNDDVAIVPGYRPVSIGEAVAMRSAYEGDPVLAPSWIPLLVGPSGDLYAAVWSDESSARVAGVLIGEPTEIEFASVEQMVLFFIACVERGAFSVTDQRLWSIDPGLYDSIYVEMVSESL